MKCIFCDGDTKDISHGMLGACQYYCEKCNISYMKYDRSTDIEFVMHIKNSEKKYFIKGEATETK
jgi:hypothetical protein